MPPSTVPRPATPDDAGLLTELALRSKAHWGYSVDFLDACRADLTVDPADCDGVSLRIAERSGRVLGFWRSVPTDDPVRGELADLFVDPGVIGTGVGRLLLTDAVAHARARGWHTLQFDADPHAEAFYRHLGAQRIGSSPSTVVPSRPLPRMVLRVTAGAPHRLLSNDEAAPPGMAKPLVDRGAPSGTRTPNPLIKSQRSDVRRGDPA